jgi:hypothetical protein
MIKPHSVYFVSSVVNDTPTLPPAVRRRYVVLLEVLIAFALTVMCALPLIYSQVFIVKSEKNFLDVVQLDHAANLLYAEMLQKLYERKIPLDAILNSKESELEEDLLEHAGWPRALPYKGTYQFVLKLKKPPEPEEKELMLYRLILTFTPKKEKKEMAPLKYEYLVFIEHRLK